MALGDKYEVHVGYDRLNAAVELNEAANAHLWIILVTYGLTDEEAAVASEGVAQMLDPGHLLAVTETICYICERPYSLVVGKSCHGQPR